MKISLMLKAATHLRQLDRFARKSNYLWSKWRVFSTKVRNSLATRRHRQQLVTNRKSRRSQFCLNWQLWRELMKERRHLLWNSNEITASRNLTGKGEVAGITRFQIMLWDTIRASINMLNEGCRSSTCLRFLTTLEISVNCRKIIHRFR